VNDSVYTLFVVYPSHTISLPSWEADTRFLQMSTAVWIHCSIYCRPHSCCNDTECSVQN